MGGWAGRGLSPPAHRWVVPPGPLRSQGGNTPFIGYGLKGRVRATIVGGTVVHEVRD